MSIEIEGSGSLEKASDRDRFALMLNGICESMKLKMVDYERSIIIDICPHGKIKCYFEGCDIAVSAQTHIGGPGFHAYVCTIFDAIVEMCMIGFEVKDATNYFYERNFEDLKYLHFYPWLQRLADDVAKQSKIDDKICISWELQPYIPGSKAGCVVTPMGYIARKDFKELAISDLARRFFIWNHKQRNAYDYRNCALTLLWEECYFAYSGMNVYTNNIASEIIDYLEAAYELDHLIPLPLQEYRTLCMSIQRTAYLHQAQEMDMHHIGYRRNCVHYRFSNWLIFAHGCCEISFDTSTQTMYFMAPYKEADEPWRWMLKANAFMHERKDTSLLPPQEGLECFTMQSKQLQGQGVIERLAEYYKMSVQVICGKDTLYLEWIIHHADDIATIKEWCYGIAHQPMIR